MLKKNIGLALVVLILLNSFSLVGLSSEKNPEDYISLESLEASFDEINWDEDRGTIEIKNNNKIFRFKVDSRIVNYIDKNSKYFLWDMAPTMIGDKVFLPKNLLDIGGDKFSSPYEDEILNIKDGQLIEGQIQLEGKISKESQARLGSVRYILVDKEDYRGRIVGLKENTSFIPRYEDNGDRLLVLAIYDKAGDLIGGQVKEVKLDLRANIKLKGLEEDLADKASLSVDLNFVPSYIRYQMTNLDKDKIELTSEIDPWGTYAWSPQVEDNGRYRIRVIAYDDERKICLADESTTQVKISHKFGLSGLKENESISKPVTLMATRNFNVLETQYILKDPSTGQEEILSTQGYGSYKWFPGPEYKGAKQVVSRVKDLEGRVHESKPIPVNLPGKALLILEGVGPKQVITSRVEIKTLANFPLDRVDYYLVNPSRGTEKLLTSKDPREEYEYTPIEDDANYSHIKAVGVYKGEKIESEAIEIKIYLGQIYGPKPIVEKDKFLDLASGMAVESWKNTSMSAALQTSQAILETGWGQSLPVDKYTGKFSNNLFGIKGSATAGSVVSNTWEEYNGTVFRIDDNFRAYNDINESWLNHKDLLLKAERYGIFRDVMYDSIMGAWAIRRAGYATDSQYPLKLMKIIKDYNLEELDKMGI